MCRLPEVLEESILASGLRSLNGLKADSGSKRKREKRRDIRIIRS